MSGFRSTVLAVVVIAALVLVVLFSHGIRVRLIWGGSGFVTGLIFGTVANMEIHHRRKHAKAA